MMLTKRVILKLFIIGRMVPSAGESRGESVPMQTRKSLRCSHTQYMDVDEDPDQNLELLACWIHQLGHLLVICNKKSID